MFISFIQNILVASNHTSYAHLKWDWLIIFFTTNTIIFFAVKICLHKKFKYIYKEFWKCKILDLDIRAQRQRFFSLLLTYIYRLHASSYTPRVMYSILLFRFLNMFAIFQLPTLIMFGLTFRPVLQMSVLFGFICLGDYNRLVNLL